MTSLKPLESTLNPFGGVHTTDALLPKDPGEFRQRLDLSLDSWQSDGLRVAWLNVPISRVELVPIAVGTGFSYHHAGEDYLMLTRRIDQDALIPQFASHYIGAGGVVLNTDDELLVVSEKHRRQKDKPYFKLPGGALHAGEHLSEAVVREVWEETGVETRFEAAVGMRNMHGYRHGKSDIYVVCRLTPLTSEITIQPEEIEECRWMPVEDYLSSAQVSPFNRRTVQSALDSPGLVRTRVAGYDDHERYEVFLPPEPR